MSSGTFDEDLGQGAGVRARGLEQNHFLFRDISIRNPVVKALGRVNLLVLPLSTVTAWENLKRDGITVRGSKGDDAELGSL